MNTIKQEMQRLNRIANLCNKTEGEMKDMWRKNWNELVNNVAMRLDESKVERSTTDSRKIH